MTELQLYKFIQDNNIEWHEHTNNKGLKDILIFVNFSELKQFSEMISHRCEDEGLQIHMKVGYVCIWMNDICETYDIDMKNIFQGRHS